jgi:hypothetical protein
VWSRTAAGRAKTPGGVPGENGSRRGSAGSSGAKCTRRAATAPGGGKSRKRTAAGGRAPNPGQRRRRCRIHAWFESEGRHLVHLAADAQREVVEGAVDDGVGTVVQRLERRYVAVQPHEHHRCAGEVDGQPRRRLAGSGGVVSSGSVFGSTQCLRKLLKKNFGRYFW